MNEVAYFKSIGINIYELKKRKKPNDEHKKMKITLCCDAKYGKKEGHYYCTECGFDRCYFKVKSCLDGRMSKRHEVKR
jgi:hypothetical protein